jgi:hypothetical protein
MNKEDIKLILKQQFPELIQYASVLENPMVLSLISMFNIDQSVFSLYSKDELAKKLRNIAEFLENDSQ